MAALRLPVVLLLSAPEPSAVFPAPVVLLKSARLPFAVLKLPKGMPLGVSEFAAAPVLLKRANAPLAVFAVPVVLLKSAQHRWPYFRQQCLQGVFLRRHLY
jgi:hypothetical protein